MLVLQSRTLDRLRIESGHAALDVGAQPGERLVDRRLVLGAEPDRVLAAIRHRGGVHDLAVGARAVLEAGEPRARLAHAERRACVELDLSGMSRPSCSLSAWTCAPAQTIARSADQRPSEV